MKCPYCGADIKPTDLFCPVCTSPLPRTEQNSRPPAPREEEQSQKIDKNSVRSVLIKKPVRRRVPRKLESRRRALTDNAPDIQTYTEEYEKKYHIPKVGGFKASEIAGGDHSVPSWVKPASIITAIVLLLVGGSVVALKYTPLVKNIQTRQECQSLTSQEESGIEKWNRLVVKAKPYLKMDDIEYTDTSLVARLEKTTSNQPKQLKSCEANPGTFRKNVATIERKNRNLTHEVSSVKTDHAKAVSEARKQALQSADEAEQWMTSHHHSGVATEQEALSDSIRSLRAGKWKTATSWINHETSMEKSLSALQNRISDLDKKSQKKAKPKPKQSQPTNQQQSAPSQPSYTPSYTPSYRRSYTPVQRSTPAPQRTVPQAPAPRRSAPSAPNNWSVPAPQQDEGRL